MEGETTMSHNATKEIVNLPNFLVVGVQKAGTTSLHHWLSEQPGVLLPKNKETHFFSSDEQYARGLDWYLKQFSYDVDVVYGEVAPDYLFSKKAPERIYQLVPTVKLIFILREPIQRAYSHYLMAVRNGYETLSFYEALKEEPKRMQKGGKFRTHYSYMSRGLYTTQINEYKEFFPDNNFMFIKFDDLIAEGKNKSVLRDIASFIGLDLKLSEIEKAIEKNNSSSNPRSQFIRNVLYSTSKLKRFFRVIIPSHDLRATIAYKLDILNQRPASKPSIGKIPNEVVRVVKREIQCLQSITGLELQDWMESLSLYDTD